MARIDDGFSTRYSFAEDSAVKMYEISCTPPGWEGGGKIDTTTMQNTTYRTGAPKSLIELTDGSITVAYDPAVLTEILAMLNANQLITITYPDDTEQTFWGFINAFSQNEMSEGERPTAEVTIIPTLQNAAGAETAPTVPS